MSSIFDSESEKRAYSTVRTHWSRFLDVYPHIPVRNALGYERLKGLSIKEKARQYLLTTEFDFVVCDFSGSPILAVEFDGLGHGFSRDGAYVQITASEDPYRKLKLDTKISACEECGLPIVVVSYPETEPSFAPDCPVTVLDAVIGEVLTGRACQNLINSHMQQFSEAMEEDPSGEAAEMLMMEIEVMAEQENPIRRRIRELRRRLPLDFGMELSFLDDRPGYTGARHSIRGGVRYSAEKTMEQVLMSYETYVRTVNCLGCDASRLANLLAEYGLARKAIRTIGISQASWQKLIDETPWTDVRYRG